jgi:hypothetical protein
MKFSEYCKKNNIQLLRDDKKFLVKQVGDLPNNRRIGVLRRFCEEWILGIKNEPITSLKQNSGRFRANSWLLNEFKEKQKQ